ncbi:sensor histidine kinase [Micromonospora sp. NPDC049171]|uniref:sensor histidine kinase n=1 Tax=Micromonospora sp. NPDC049171 TaxID=3155770 RepID=UPI0033FD6165
MRRWVVETMIVAAVGVLTAYRLATTPVALGDRVPDLWAYAAAAVMVFVLFVRRRWPVGVLALVGGLYLAYHIYHYPGGATAVPAWVALYSVGAASRQRVGLIVAALFVLLDAQGRVAVAGARPFDTSLDSSTVVFVAALLLGEVVRGRRTQLALLAADQSRAAEQRVVEERIRIARELHDVTAHTLAVVSVQAGVAADVLDEDPAQARAALREVRRASREAMVELRAAVGVLRDGTPAAGPEPPTPTLDRLPALAESTGAVVTCDGEPRALPRAVETTAYRIVQEAVTNALRHAGAARIEVRVGYRPDGLSVTVRDNGRGGVPVAGNGLRGMAERAGGLGGWLRAGPADGGGFEVRGWLPV